MRKGMYVKNKPHNSIDILVRRAARKELFQYSVGKKMDNAKKTEMFCDFLLHFFTKRSATIRWQAQHQQKGRNNKSKNSELQATEYIEVNVLNYDSLNLLQQVLYNPE